MAKQSTRLAEYVKRKVSVWDVLNQYHVAYRGEREQAILCPFHDEKTPSFRIYEDGFHCYGACAQGGDVIWFVQKMENLGFWEACERLAEVHGFDITGYKTHRLQAREPKLSARLQEWADVVQERLAGYAQDIGVETVNGFLAEYRTIRDLIPDITEEDRIRNLRDMLAAVEAHHESVLRAKEEMPWLQNIVE